MDKTIEIVVVAMIALVTGLIVLFLVNGQTDGFENFLGGQQDSAECDLWESDYKSTCGGETGQLGENPGGCNAPDLPESCPNS